MKIFGIDFPARQRRPCETCGEPLILTERLPNSERGFGYETLIFQCYACRREFRRSVAP
jgi:hypothetical protein